jgi:hypothetical protein
MRIPPLLIIGTLVALPLDAQERWRHLPGGAARFAVDLESLAIEAGVLRARVRTPIDGTILEEQLEIRCSSEQLRTIASQEYDGDTGQLRRSSRDEDHRRDIPWAGYAPGSEGHALLTSVCRLAREKGAAEHSRG